MTEFINWLNANQGVIGFLSLLITIVGFFVVNKNITKISQNQNIKNNSKGLQGGRDAVDKSINFKN